MTSSTSIAGFRPRRLLLLALPLVVGSCLRQAADAVPWPSTVAPPSAYGTGFAPPDSTLAPGVDDADRPEGLAAAEGFGYFGVGQHLWIMDLRRPAAPLLVGRTPPLPQRIGPLLWHDQALYAVQRGLDRPPDPALPMSEAPGLRDAAARQRRDPDSLVAFDLTQPDTPRLRQPAVASLKTIMDLVTAGDRLCAFGGTGEGDGGAAQCLTLTGSGLTQDQNARHRVHDLHFTDAAPVADRFYSTYGRVLTSDLEADEPAAQALSDAINTQLGRGDWMLPSGQEAAGSTLFLPVDVGGCCPPRDPQFQALLGVDVANPSRPIVAPGMQTLPQDTIASLKIDGDRLFTLERTAGCRLHVYSLANGLVPRGSVALPTDGMCDGGLHYLPDEGQRIAVTGDAVLVGYDPEAVYVVDVSDPDKPFVTGSVDIRQAPPGGG
jgi:hypothetical protein